MKNKWFAMAMGLLLMAGISGVALGLVHWLELRGAPFTSITLTQPAQNQPTQIDANQFVGAYSGVVKLNTTVTGVYSDTLATPPPPGAGTPPPPDLGSIDLSLTLSQTNSALSGYVSLDKTLVYSVEHTLGSGASAVKIGPYLSGVVNGSNINVQSEKISLTVDGRALQRQFRLLSTSVTNNGAQLEGEYRETLWGYTSAPITVIGAFTLQRAGANAITPVLAPTAPNVVADTGTTTQGQAVTINVLSNDSAANGGTLTITAVGKPQFGTATTDGKTVTYTPNANFTGTDTFSYVASDGKGGTSTGSVTVIVNGPGGANQPPTATNDTATTAPGVAILIDVLANDSDPNGDPLSISIDGAPQHGTAVVQNGKVLYTPNSGFSGTDNFTYVASDDKGGTATALVTITVNGSGGSNHAPTAANDVAATTSGSAVTIDVLANDADPDGDALAITIDGPPSHGVATVTNGKIVYTPETGFVGGDSFTYIVSDGKGGTATASVTVTVNDAGGSNHAPVAGNDSATTTQGTAVTINVLANDSDPDGDALTVSITSQPSHGDATVNNGQIIYMPNTGFVGSDSFTYTIVDGKGGAASATVTVTVTQGGQAGGNSLYLPLVQR